MFFLLLPLQALFLSAPTAAASSLGNRVVVETRGQEDAVLESVLLALGRERVNPKLASQALKVLDLHVECEVGKGQKVLLFPMGIGALARAASEKNWDAAEIGRLLVAVQRRVDGRTDTPALLFQRTLAAIRDGQAAAKVIARLAQGSSGTRSALRQASHNKR